MKINICYDFLSTPSGGGNQFLKTLKNEFMKRDLYTDDYNNMDILLYNGHQKMNEVVRLKELQKKIKFKMIHRLDGLQKLYNQPNDIRQDQAFAINKLSDGTVFQSEWIRERFKDYKFDFHNTNAVIGNAVDPDIFKLHKSDVIRPVDDKIRLVTTCWSPNKNKGFDYYEYLDKHLDFDKYEYIFIGNLPNGLKFKNIKCIGPKTTKEIAHILPQCDVFISGAKYECLSNSIIEAHTCGLPVISHNSGGEVYSLKFDTYEQLIPSIHRVIDINNYYGSIVKPPSIKEITDKYINFFQEIINEK